MELWRSLKCHGYIRWPENLDHIMRKLEMQMRFRAALSHFQNCVCSNTSILLSLPGSASCYLSLWKSRYSSADFFQASSDRERPQVKLREICPDRFSNGK